MQQSRDKYFPQLENQGINPVGNNTQVTNTCTNNQTLAPNTIKGLSIPSLSRANTTRENPSSSAGFEAISSAGTRATNKALQLTVSSSAVCTRATTIDYISSAFSERATIS